MSNGVKYPARIFCRTVALSMLFGAFALSVFSAQAQSSPPQAIINKSQTGTKIAKVWTNDDLKTLHGGVSVVGSTASASKPKGFNLPYGEATDDISIVSPRDGAVVHPGGTISIEVRVSSGLNLAGLAVESPIGIGSELGPSEPHTTSLQVPSQDEPGESGPLIGRQPITAIGVASDRKLLESNPVVVDVERPDLPISLSPQIPQLIFENIGDSFPLVMLAKFEHNVILDVTESTYLSYASSDVAVATVNSEGMVTAGGPGSASIIVAYSHDGKSIQTEVPVTLGSLQMDVLPRSLNFGRQSVGVTSAAQTLTITNRAHSAMKIIQIQSPPIFSETDDCRAPLDSGASCTVRISFRPTTVGPVQGSLSIINKTNSGETEIPLSGTGQ